jgi:ATP-dependent helicase HrpB
MELDPRAVARADHARRQIGRQVHDRAPAPSGEEQRERALLACVLAGFPDRVARRRRRGERDLVLANGKIARLSESSVVHDAHLLVAVDVDERAGRGTVVRSASAVDEDLLFELSPERLEMKDDLAFVPDRERVERISTMRWGALLLDETRAAATPSDATAAVLFGAAQGEPSRFVRSQPALELATRLELLAEHFSDAAFPEDASTILENALRAACGAAASFAELERSGWLGLANGGLSERQRRLLESETPERIRLAGGRSVVVHYEKGRAPFVESRLQDFFGSAEGPRILGARLPLTLHLLAPNQRAVQVTTDLAGFWQRHYPSVRRELMRRYPRHAWPEDGRTATPPAPAPKRR